MENENRYIIVCTNGFVHVGTWTGEKDDEGYHIVEDSSIIRRWGTEKGLGQLAIDGIQKDTVLDYEGVIAINPLHLIRKIICVAKI